MKILKLAILLLLLFSFDLHAQSSKKKQLEKQQNRLENDIKFVNKLILENNKASKASTVQVTNINEKIKLRRSIIQNINHEINRINTTISKKQLVLTNLEKELEDLKTEYSKIIIQSYKSRNRNNSLTYLLSAENFNQARKRLKYINDYSKYRKTQGEKIRLNKSEILIVINNLNAEKEVKDKLVSSKQKEREKLVTEKKEREVVLKKLKLNKEELLAEVKLKQQKTVYLQNEIQKIILAEIRKAELAKKERERLKRIADANNPTKGNDDNSIYETITESKKLAVKFELNKHKLPWPVKKGLVASNYGKHRHPKYKDIVIVNHGIDIATLPGSSARSIFKGIVSSVIISNNGGSNTVIIKHGDYYSVYSNLNKIYVSKGDKVDIKQNIGLISTSLGSTIVKFQLWHNKKIQNPALWLYNM
ncbi:MAG: peptidoglycan DD-metalloendopeptidase family protein [Ichthyobacteriaceae bacterium]|nr:peptidoglycan DD-metalloendopeptidase family protein [Ichthyobacteriaceae bacterium]